MCMRGGVINAHVPCLSSQLDQPHGEEGLGKNSEVLPVGGSDSLAWWWYSFRCSGFCWPDTPQSSGPSALWVSVPLENLST